MKINKQQEILRYLKTVEKATLKEIYENVSWSYYGGHYTMYMSLILSRMVKNGTVERVKKGTFKFKRNSKHFTTENIPDTYLQLF